MSDYPLQFDTYEEEVAFKNQVEEWADQYGAIYTTEINEVAFVFRGVSLAEMDKANKIYTDLEERMEYICRLCVLYPYIEDYSIEIYAGVPQILCETILDESGYGEDPTKVNNLIMQYEREMEETQYRIPCIIHEVFTEHSLEEIENWSIEKIAKYYTRAKWTLENLRGIVLTNGEEEEIPPV